jgi:hypothetical protein
MWKVVDTADVDTTDVDTTDVDTMGEIIRGRLEKE